MQWTGLLRINHQLIGKGVDSHQHQDSEMGISENAVASRITRYKHREGISKDQINVLTPVMNRKERNDVPLLDCAEWDCTSSYWAKWHGYRFISLQQLVECILKR